jgi:hypothetical protein
MYVLCKLINPPISLVKELFTYKCTYKSTAISVVVYCRAYNLILPDVSACGMDVRASDNDV